MNGCLLLLFVLYAAFGIVNADAIMRRPGVVPSLALWVQLVAAWPLAVLLTSIEDALDAQGETDE